MKKILFLAAAAAISFAACTSDEVAEQQTQQPAADIGVGFDVYLPGATQATRAGRTNVMTTTTLQQTGFGIFGYQTDNTGYSSGIQPGYMWNQQVFYNSSAAGWYYAPLKYWPNETGTDSQLLPTKPAGMPNQDSNNSIDKLSFFAYAPWVKAAQSDGITSTINESLESTVGITRVTNTEGVNVTYTTSKRDPLISYIVASDPNESVDLLWGVAPAGGLSYTDVSGKNVSINEGMPLKDLTKPAVNTNLKFMFQHALARLGVKVVAAVDQVAAGGVFDYGNSKITIDEIVIDGNYGISGVLNLNNTVKNQAVWYDLVKGTGAKALVIKEGQGLAPHLVYNKTLAEGNTQQEVTGVTTTLADAIKVRSSYDANYWQNCATVENTPVYSPTRPYFAAAADIATTPTPTYAAYTFTKDPDSTYFHKYVTNDGVAYTDITSTINTKYPKATVWENIYAVKKEEIRKVVADGSTLTGNEIAISTVASCKAYRKVNDAALTYTETKQPVQVGDYVFFKVEEKTPTKCTLKKTTGSYYKAMPNYFMVIPSGATGNGDTDKDLRTLKVKITYYVSTTDASLKNGIVYTKNEVEKDVVLPHLKNGVAYDLKLILGLTSVKVEAEVADWTTTEGVINLPQNTSE